MNPNPLDKITQLVTTVKTLGESLKKVSTGVSKLAKEFELATTVQKRLYHCYKNAFVTLLIDGYLNVLTVSATTGLPQPLLSQSIPIKTRFSAFLIKGNYIITSLLATSYPTLTSMQISLNGQDYIVYIWVSHEAPIIDPIQLFDPSTIPELQNPINFYKIRARIRHVNDSDCDVCYKACVLGIDGARNLAVLRIDDLDQENQGLPPLGCNQDYLEWGNSQDVCVGDIVMFFCLREGSGIATVINTTVSVNTYITDLNPKEESVLISSGSQIWMSGGPVLNKSGKVIGVCVDPFTFRVISSHQAQYIIDAIISGIHGPLGCHLTTTNLTNCGPITVFVQPIMGFRYRITCGNGLEVQEDIPTLNRYVVKNDMIKGTVCSMEWCGTNYCMGDSKKHYNPIQLTYRAVVGDVVCLKGVNNGVCYELPVIFQAPNPILLFIPDSSLTLNGFLGFFINQPFFMIQQGVQAIYQAVIQTYIQELLYANSFI